MFGTSVKEKLDDFVLGTLKFFVVVLEMPLYYEEEIK